MLEGRGSICDNRAFARPIAAFAASGLTENGIMRIPMRWTVAFLLILLPWATRMRTDDELLVKTYPVTITTDFAGSLPLISRSACSRCRRARSAGAGGGGYEVR